MVAPAAFAQVELAPDQVIPSEPDKPGHLVEMVVARIDDSVITLSELVAETRLVLLRTRGFAVARQAETPRPLLRAVLRSIVHRELLLGEVRRLDVQVPEERARGRAREIGALFPDTEAYGRFLRELGIQAKTEGGDPAFIARIIRSELQTEAYLNLRLNVPVFQPQVVSCYKRNRDKFEGKTRKQAFALIREKLSSERTDAALRELILQLELRASIWYAPGFTPPPLAPRKHSLDFECSPN